MCNTMTYITKQYKHVKSANNSLQHPSILMLKGRGLVFLADVIPCLNGGGESYILSQAEDYPVLYPVYLVPNRRSFLWIPSARETNQVQMSLVGPYCSYFVCGQHNVELGR